MLHSATFGKNLQAYEEKMSQKLSIEGGIWGFSASLNETFTKNAVNTKENSYYSDRYSKEMKLYSIVSNATIDKLINCLNADFKRDGEKSCEIELKLLYLHNIINFCIIVCKYG